mmetsp:Transcript_56737/g.128608  ORF Transcript_56737/g.128608 Transcript_56737/m.128608 type:complete len:318 (+) Transcript_56737:104-1057(+)|eukprot:CAMPEP_0172587616 /NCGR_PEP_ID=MMETSP1068-20121228/6637_1 /TAXON_ID=35684 /ORGANISM="Pseudopedinella elastica, Strain CCMP716" /LENGTH=317 /DNA_ID=CAMNT_0013382687 /DNA_START=67 /DNA_END=1020 /DNA_ORIENTATION=+
MAEFIPSSQVKIFVGNLPFDATAETLERAFSQYGEIIGAKLCIDRTTRKPRGFGFVTFATEEACNSALKASGHEASGRPLTVKPAVARGTGSLKDLEDEDDFPQFMAASKKKTAAPCRFFAKSGGCKNGAACKYSHVSMESWTGPDGVEINEKKVKSVKTKVASKAADDEKKNEISRVDRPQLATVPLSVQKTAAERLEFLNRKILSDGEPTSQQLGAFLGSVVKALRSAADNPGASFDMVPIAWDYRKNQSLPGRNPPTVSDVKYWLSEPKFTPSKMVTIADFNKRSQASSIGTLLEEYGEFDTSWRESSGTGKSD